MTVTPDIIEQQALTALRDHHTERLAQLERDRGLPARTIEAFRTIDLLAGEGFRLRDDKPPAALLGVFGTTDQPNREKDATLTFNWTLAVQITVIGVNRADTMKRRGWYALTACECLLMHLPRLASPVDAVALNDLGFTNGTADIQDRQRTIGEAQLLFDVHTRATLAVQPPYDATLPPGSPGGPPIDPYAPPVEFPPAQTVTSTTSKEIL